MRFLRSIATTLALAACFAAPAAAQVESLTLEQAAARLAGGGWVMMMRHAQTVPGIGDPPEFRVDDCATQRNLSDEGRAQSRRIGAALLAAGIRVAQVRSSQWCRCLDTARLAFGAHEPWPALNSFFGDRGTEPDQSRQVVEFARSLRAPANAMLVTHQVNISAVFGVGTAPGEIVAGRWREGRLAEAFRFQADRR